MTEREIHVLVEMYLQGGLQAKGLHLRAPALCHAGTFVVARWQRQLSRLRIRICPLHMSQLTSDKPLPLTQSDLDALYALSLKDYRFLTCRHLAMLYYSSEIACKERMTILCQAGLATRLYVPTTNGKRGDVIYTLSRIGAHELASLRNMSPVGLATIRKPSYFFLEHGLKVSDFMCSLEAALKHTNAQLLSWKSERQLKSNTGRVLKVPHPFELGEKIPVIPDGFFSIGINARVEYLFLEADRGTMSLYAMKKKLFGYIQLYRSQLHKRFFGIPHFRVLLVTNTAYRRDRLRKVLRELGYCQNMFWFSTWEYIEPVTILSKIWLKSRDQIHHSLLE